MPSKKLAMEWKKRQYNAHIFQFVSDFGVPNLLKLWGYIDGTKFQWDFHPGTSVAKQELAVWGDCLDVRTKQCIEAERALRDHLKPYAELYNKLVAVHGEGGE